MDFKTNCAGADKHVDPSGLNSKGHEGHYHVNAPIDSIPLSLTVNTVRIAQRRGSDKVCHTSGEPGRVSQHQTGD